MLLTDSADVELDICVLQCLLSCLDCFDRCCDLIACKLVDDVIDDEPSSRIFVRTVNEFAVGSAVCQFNSDTRVEIKTSKRNMISDLDPAAVQQ